ncbi:MAG: Uma2 family endonuclease, partial [Aquificaceae bacterium]|nr:Uma2 family endonuclease [Aquificaceae bacterium]
MKLKYVPYYTYEDYKKWQGDWELVEGVPYAMASSKLINQVVLFNFIRVLGSMLEREGCECAGAVEVDWVISGDTVVRPDLSVICEGFEEDYIRRPPVMVVEVVSESTRRMDEEVKFELYEREGVKYYLLLYPETRSWKLFENISGRFVSKDTLELELKGCEVSLDL